MPTVPCPTCGGSGILEVIDRSRYVTCYYCHGSCKDASNRGPCLKCNGNGVIYYLVDVSCYSCAGTGNITY